MNLWEHLAFNAGYWTALWGAFEMAYQSPSHPVWSGTWGAPMPHHYLVGFIVSYSVYLYASRREMLEVYSWLTKKNSTRE